MTTYWKKLGAWVDACEQWPWGPTTVALTLAAVIALRNVLEIMLARNPMFSVTAAFVHYPLAYLGPFLALTLTLAFWAKLAPARVTRLMTVAWTLTLLPPLVDVLLHRTREIPTIGYYAGDPSELAWLVIHFFDPRVTLGGTTPGIRFETASAVLLAGVYVLLRAGRVWRALGAAISVYFVSLAFFTLPLLVLSVMRWFEPALEQSEFLRNSGVTWRGEATTLPDSIAILWLLPVLALAVWVFSRLERRHPSEAWLLSTPGVSRQLLPSALITIPWGGYLVGLSAAWFLFLPDGPTLAISAFDRLALPGAALTIWLGLRALATEGVYRSVLVLGWIAASVALDRAFGIPALAAVLAFAPWSAQLFGSRLRGVLGALSGAVSGLCACAAGFCLIVGPEGLARLPLQVAAFAICYGAAAAYIVSFSEISIVRSALALLIASSLGCLAWGDARLLLVALPAALIAAGLGGFLDGAFEVLHRHRATLWLSMVAVVMLARGGLSFPALREPLRQQVSCVARLHRLQGEGFMRQQQWGSAATSFNQALACDPNDAGSLRQVAFLARDVDKKYERALDYFQRAARAAPESPQEWTNLAAIQLDLQRPADALAAADTGLRLAPRDTALLHNRAQALLALDRRTEAAEALRTYIRLASPRREERDTVRKAERDLAALQQTGATPR
ncbi:MAG: hypothetical protein U0V87_10540 [Acidobacteriota bacterium]